MDIYKCPKWETRKEFWKRHFWKMNLDHNALKMRKTQIMLLCEKKYILFGKWFKIFIFRNYMKQNETDLGQYSSAVWCCKTCDYSTSRKSQLERHFATPRHIMKQNETQIGTILM